jgi:hypothetical protein
VGLRVPLGPLSHGLAVHSLPGGSQAGGLVLIHCKQKILGSKVLLKAHKRPGSCCLITLLSSRPTLEPGILHFNMKISCRSESSNISLVGSSGNLRILLNFDPEHWFRYQALYKNTAAASIICKTIVVNVFQEDEIEGVCSEIRQAVGKTSLLRSNVMVKV